MSYPRIDHLSTVRDGDEFHGNLAIFGGETPTYTLTGNDGCHISSGELRGDPPDYTLFDLDRMETCGYIECSESPDGATIWCDTWPSGQVKTLHD